MHRDPDRPKGSSPEIGSSDILAGLVALGIRRGDVIEVHSSLRSFGHVRGGAATVVEALLEAVGPDGSVVMSAYRVSRNLPLTDEDCARGVTLKLRYLDEGSAERSGMGAVVDEFLRRDGVVCGAGTHRLCAWGHEAQQHVADAYQHLVDSDGWAVLLGVGIETCSSLHLADRDIRQAAPHDIRQYYRTPEEVRNAYPPEIMVLTRAPYAVLWPRAHTEAERRGLVRRRVIGEAECSAFRVRQMLEVIKDVFHADPYAALDVPRVERSATRHRRLLTELTDELIAMDPDCSILLLGSMAEGEEREDSDIDIIVAFSQTPTSYTDLITASNHQSMKHDAIRSGIAIDIGWSLLTELPDAIPQTRLLPPYPFAFGKIIRDPSGRMGLWLGALNRWLDERPWLSAVIHKQYREMRRHKNDPRQPLRFNEKEFNTHLKKLILEKNAE